MSVTLYEVIKRKMIVSGICQKCFKRRTRTVFVYQTVSPFNIKNGVVKSRREIYTEVFEEVKRQADELKKNFICFSCS